ncbi:MAG TPA: CDP-alcohol phosphatidyltransferase family protein [Gemmatimonadales bacterium]|jgi:CDP-diacylglycerol--glycerol-3-phosphate 3-phosphatidyltransferase|nr:CDP-alcohol phosphatidyltransferase family protein [Gemmatimonadales bacterium]
MNVIPQIVKDGFVRLVAPIARAAIRAKIRPNVITTIGTLIVIGAGVAFGFGAIRLGGLLVLLSGVFDILDGQVARQGAMMTTFGAFYDSTLDRVGEAAVFAGLAVYFERGGVPLGQQTWALGLALAALTMSMLVSYARARAEGLGLECKVGIAPRAERILILGAPAMLFGPGRNGMLLFWIVAVLAVAATITVVQRVVYVARIADTAPRQTVKRETLPGVATRRKGH